MVDEKDIERYIYKVLQERFGNYFNDIRIQVLSVPANKLRVPPDKLIIPGDRGADRFGIERHKVC